MARLHALHLLDGNPAGGFVVHAGRLWFSLQHAVIPRPDDDHLDAETLGVCGMPIEDVASLRMVRVPGLFPVRPTGSTGARREARVVARAGDGLFMVVNAPFRDDRGWGREHFLLHVDTATGAWRALSADGLPLRALTAADTPDERALSLGTGDLLCRVQPGELHLAVDGTAYHLEDWEPAVSPAGAIAVAGVEAPVEQRRSRMAPPHELESMVGNAAARQEPTWSRGGDVPCSILHVHTAPDGSERVVARLFTPLGWMGALAHLQP